jgi:hypothetical protein
VIAAAGGAIKIHLRILEVCADCSYS